MVALIKLDGAIVGAAESDGNEIGVLAWFHANKPSCSASHALEHEGYSVETVEEIDCRDVADILERIAERMGLAMTADFVPFSQSANATIAPGRKEPWQSLNWRIAISRHGRAALDTKYAQGIAYAPAYKRKWGGTGANNPHVQRAALDIEIETGRIASAMFPDKPVASKKPVPAPRFGDVLHGLTRDADVLDYPSFEAWASEYGYDPDSRAAERVFSECMRIAMGLRAAIGQSGLDELRLVAQFN